MDAMPSPPRSPILIAADGEPVYRVRSGSAYRTVRAHDVGNGLFVFDSPVNNVEISDVEVTGGYRVIENSASGGGKASCEQLLVADVRATGLRRGFARMRYASRGGRFRNITAEGVMTTGATDLPVGIALDGTANDFRFERCVMRGFRWQRRANKYWNGDGFSTERGNRNIHFASCEAWDNSDGGFDLKSSGTVLDDCVAGRNARNYRLWSDITATRLTSIDPAKLGGTGDTNHISLMASKTAGAPPLVIRIQHLIVRSERGWPIFDIHDGSARIFVESHDITVPPGTPLTRSRGGGKAVGGVQFAGAPPQL
ncbi:hypothetical protein OK349_09305 [Sphingomonas sp. BT-65]|uniref:hypothetical protein n=1 Tax=Sphingomonas sp. BT-65 TaxID=2989821 RepID=UPI002236B0F0|nr:hypothetical protein [Sphingomonas sp. BT-65]MCW4461904.1 hypothetical protein [Sphingomonas sp. BT-65]